MGLYSKTDNLSEINNKIKIKNEERNATNDDALSISILLIF